MNPTSAPDDLPLRTFVAVQVPADIQTAVGEFSTGLGEGLPKTSVRWVRRENIHLTLRFVGNVSSHDVNALTAAVRTAAQGIEPFAVRLSEPGCFPTERSPRVLWVGLGGDLERLTLLQSRVAETTAAWGRGEERDFHPHLTLGRVVTKQRSELQRITKAIRNASVPQCAPWPVAAIHLMKSELATGGSRYSTLVSVPLMG